MVIVIRMPHAAPAARVGHGLPSPHPSPSRRGAGSGALVIITASIINGVRDESTVRCNGAQRHEDR